MELSTHTSGRTKMIKSWVVLYFDSLYSWAFYKTSSKESAEDLVQDTFLVALKSIDQFEGKSNALMTHQIIKAFDLFGFYPSGNIIH